MRFVPSRLDLFKELPPKTEGAEIGVQSGIFSQQILLTDVAKLHLVDCWEWQDGTYAKDPANVSQSEQDWIYEYVKQKLGNNPRVQIHRKWSYQFVQSPPKLDWVYIDADHTYDGCLGDLVRFDKIIEPGGCIMGHDFIMNGKSMAMGFDVISAVEKFCLGWGWKIDALTEEEWSSYKLVRK